MPGSRPHVTQPEASPSTPAAVAAPASQAARPRRGSCCLRSCLGCLVLLLLAGGGLLFAWLRFGSPWVESQKTRLVERFPIVEELLTLTSGASFRGITLAGGEIGSTERADLPDDIWIPDGYVSGTFNVMPEQVLAVLTLEPTEPADLAARARSAMAALGWQRKPVPDPHDGVALYFERDDRMTSMQIYALEHGTELWLRQARRTPAPPPG